ncbi:MAG TPA: S-methyl-5-thioribose-1-phosphate isomerase [Ignavibacteriaceae bacterium]|nr:S-methyl-5-thioribose-1-phosphate isomerase [Ignavibacteriaceae bacterium]
MNKKDYFSIKFEDGKLIFLDQTKLPLKEIYIETDSYERVAEAIEKLEVRGAPLIGIAAAYAVALAFKNKPEFPEMSFQKVYDRIKRTRPTAVNLFSALNEMKSIFEKSKTDKDNLYRILLDKAIEFHNNDIKMCANIGHNGLSVFKKKSKVLTHCNTGKLATGGDGTAFSVIKTGFENGLVEFVYVDETRPLLQGARLTSFELEKSGIPFALQTDSMAASLMEAGRIDFVITGADRIALNGDSANKIGTYNLAILCNYHNIPFYIAAPTTTIDREMVSGNYIEIEFRSKEEILKFNGIPVTPQEYEAYSPAFDVTPAHLITGIITEEKVYTSPYNFIK